MSEINQPFTTTPEAIGAIPESDKGVAGGVAELESVTVGVAVPDAGEGSGSTGSIRVNLSMASEAFGILTSCQFYASTAGTVAILVMRKEGTGSRWTIKRAQPLTITSTGLQSHSLSLIVDKGDVMGVWHGTGQLTQAGEPGIFNDLYSVTGIAAQPSGTVNISTGPSLTTTQINFSIAYLSPSMGRNIEIVATSATSLLIYVPMGENSGARWEFIRLTTASNPNNLDKWLLSRVYPVYRLDEYSYQPRIGGSSVTTYGSTWEHAVQVSGDADFCGGVAHGWEKLSSVNFITDGKIWTPASGNYRCSSLSVIQENTLNRYKTNSGDSEDKIADVTEIFNFNPGVGVRLRQNLRFSTPLTLQMAYLGMWPIERTEGVYSISSSEIRSNNGTVRDISTSGHSITYTSGTSECIIWDSGNGLSFNWKQTKEAGSEQLFFISNSVAYNKLYRQGCSGLSPVTSATKWDTEHIYSIAP